MQFVRPADTASMARRVAALRSADLTYADVGATLRGEQPTGFRIDHYRTDLGRGAETFERAVRGLQTWQAHRLAGMRVLPEDSVIAAQEIVIVTIGSRLVALAAPCRVIGVVDEPDRWGFAYGTLPGHPEQGEEAFVVARAEDGAVRFEVTVCSRPGDLMVKFSGPVGRWLQRRGSNGYLRALHRYVERGGK